MEHAAPASHPRRSHPYWHAGVGFWHSSDGKLEHNHGRGDGGWGSGVARRDVFDVRLELISGAADV